MEYALSNFATLQPHIYEIAPTKWINWDSSSDLAEMALIQDDGRLSGGYGRISVGFHCQSFSFLSSGFDVGLNYRGINLYRVRSKRRWKESIKKVVKNILIDSGDHEHERRRWRVWVRTDQRFRRILGFWKWVDLGQSEIGGWLLTKNQISFSFSNKLRWENRAYLLDDFLNDVNTLSFEY